MKSGLRCYRGKFYGEKKLLAERLEFINALPGY